MKSLMLAACAAAVLLLPVRSSAQSIHADSPRVGISVISPILIGTTLLPAGDYKFQCRMIDGTTYLVVTEAESRREILRVRCEQEGLAAKVTGSELRTIVRPDGKRVLQSVRIKGELVAHRLVE
jgi:hypothetical protein